MQWSAAAAVVLLARVSCWGADVGPRDDHNTISSAEQEEDYEQQTSADVGERLLVTPYLRRGEADQARRLSRVKGGPFPDHVESYSGFFTIDQQLDSNLFFWFFPAEKNYPEAPVIVWLQGGPGQPSLIGIFMEIGPFFVSPDNLTLQDNPYSWHKNYSVLFIDNPVGTGFSYTKNESGYATNQKEIGIGLYHAVIQFFTLFPELKGKPLYVAGESYGGKHAISLAHFIHRRNPTAKIPINLKGLFIVSGFFDPISCLHYSDLLYQVGLIDFNDRKIMKSMEIRGRKYIRNGNFEAALRRSDEELLFYENLSGMPQVENIVVRNTVAWDSESKHALFLQRPDARRAIHVGGHQGTMGVSMPVYFTLKSNQMCSVKRWLEGILNAGYRVVSFSGQLDLIVAYPLSVRMYLSLNFTASEEYRLAKRRNWYEDGKLAGYIKSAGNFTEVLVRGAGHMVPLDQPRRILSIVNAVINEASNDNDLITLANMNTGCQRLECAFTTLGNDDCKTLFC